MIVRQGVLSVRDIDGFLKKYGKKVAFVNADYVVDEHHVRFAAKKAIKAWKDGRRIAKTLPLEILLYSAATRQVRDALRVGISEGENRVVAVFLENVEVDGFKEKDVLEMDEKKFRRIVRFFEITDTELALVENRLSLLVRERIILFDINK